MKLLILQFFFYIFHFLPLRARYFSQQLFKIILAYIFSKETILQTHIKYEAK